MIRVANPTFYPLVFLGMCVQAGHGRVAKAASLRLVTWNLNWFTLSSDMSRLPDDVPPRSATDIAALARVAASLHADVVALQETDGPEAAAALFPPDRYAIQFTSDHVVQRTGFAIARDIAFTVNPDVTSLDVSEAGSRALRSGADVTLHLPSHQDLRLLNIHLKSGCAELELNRSLPACQSLAAQIGPLAAWIAARQEEGVAFAVMGDFNRVMDRTEPMLDALLNAAPMTRVTEGFANPCWDGERFIDHILLGGDAVDWLVPHSLLVTTYDAKGLAARSQLSDHCPVSIRLVPPD